MHYLEPYAKEKNVLQLSLFYFGKGQPKSTVTQWEDKTGQHKLECISKYGVPGSFDQDTYTACMRIWVRQEMPEDGIKLNYSDIARELRLAPPKNYIKQIKDSLKRLAQARYEFTRCFIQALPDGRVRKKPCAAGCRLPISIRQIDENDWKRSPKP